MAASGSRSTTPPVSISREVHEVWGAIDTLRNDMSVLKTDVASIGVKIDSLAGAVTQVARSAESSRQTPWNVIFGTLAIIVSLGTAVGGAALAPLYLSDSYMTRQIEAHIAGDGHPGTTMVVAGLVKDITRLDGDVEGVNAGLVELDKKSVERHAIVGGRIDGLDVTLQREMRMLMDISDAKFGALKERIMELVVQKEKIEARVLNLESSHYTSEMARDDLAIVNGLIRELSKDVAGLAAGFRVHRDIDEPVLRGDLGSEK